MPTDDLYYQRDDFLEKAVWSFEFILIPRRSWISNKKIWLKKAYKGTRIYNSSKEPMYDYRWITKEELLLAKLRGRL